MRLSRTLLSLALAAGPLAATDGPDTYDWFQVQGGISGHGLHNPDNNQPAVGLGLGRWITPKVGIEASALGTYVDYGYGKAKELQGDGSVLFNPFATPSTVRPFLRLGLGAAKVGSPVSATGAYTTRLNGVVGVGAQYLVGEKAFWSLEGRVVEIQTRATRKEGQLLAGLGMRWGGQPIAVAAYTPAEPPAAPTVEAVEAPAVVVVPVPSATQQYCTILDLQFDIDRSVIQREDQERLAVVGTFMTRYPGTAAVIEGHSDNVGTPEHNLDLSKQRADSVVAYLTSTFAIDPSRLSAVGYGDSRPIADNATEDGKRRNRRIDAVIACVTDVEGLTVAPARMTMALVIDYDRNKADIKPEYAGELAKVGDFMKANPTVTASIEGHTGNLQTTPALAMEISRRRAQNVVDYLVDKLGVDRARLSSQGFGDNRRFAYNTSAEGAKENRRVNIIFNYPQ